MQSNIAFSMHRYLTICALFCIPALAWAVRTDTVYMRNGDRITGEIKFMADDKLSYKTDRAGTIAIEWPEVVRIHSNNYFDIIMTNDERLYGSLKFADSVGFVIIKLGTDEQVKRLSDIVSIERIKTSFWERLAGSLGLSVSYAKANSNLQINGNFDITHRTVKQVHMLKGSSVLTSTATSELTERSNYSYAIRLLHNTRWFSSYSLQYERNTELNIDSRYILFAGGGKYFMRRPKKEFYGVAGLAGNQEFTISEPVTETTNLELLVQGVFHQFKFRNPQIDIFMNVTTYTSFTNLGRFRLDAEVKLLWELFNDFKWNITFYNNFDSRQAGTEQPNNDWSILTGITYTL